MVAKNDEQRKTIRRKKIFVDPRVQGALLRHLFFTWGLVVAIIAALLLAVESYNAEFALSFSGCLAAIWDHNAALIICVGVLTPIFVLDSIKLSHRFAGPMVAFRRTLRELGEGKKVDPLRFRENDYWQDLAVNLNQVIDRVNKLEAEVGEETGAESLNSEEHLAPA